MANKHKGEVEIQLGKRKVDLKFGFNAIAELEDLTGKSITELSDYTNIGFKFLRSAVYCGAKHNFKAQVTPEQIGEWLDESINDFKEMQELTQKVMQALQFALTGGEELDEDDIFIDEAEEETGN